MFFTFQDALRLAAGRFISPRKKALPGLQILGTGSKSIEMGCQEDSLPDTRYRILDAGYSILDTGISRFTANDGVYVSSAP